MDNLRTLIQTQLDSIVAIVRADNVITIDSGVPTPDEMIEDNQTYFGYSLSDNYIDSDFDRNYSMQLSINGHLVRKNNNAENTLQILDSALSLLLEKLKELNFKCRYEDVTMDNNIRKIHVTGYVRYNEINNWLI